MSALQIYDGRNGKYQKLFKKPIASGGMGSIYLSENTTTKEKFLF